MYFFNIKKKVALADLLFLCEVITLTSYNKPETVTALEVVVVDVDVSGKNHYIHSEEHNTINFTFESLSRYLSLKEYTCTIISRLRGNSQSVVPRYGENCCLRPKA